MSEETHLSVATHPRAPGSIVRIRARFALGAVLLVGLVSARAGLGADAIVGRAVLGGLVGYLVGWAVGVLVWRELVKLEFRAAVRRQLEGRRHGG